jgi:hypothetical protein
MIGRVLIATNIADVVIREKSLVVYNDMIELLDKVFNHLSAEEKELLYAS